MLLILLFKDLALLAAFAISFKFRKEIAAQILKIKLPKLVLYLLTITPLIIFEEQVNCQPVWCGNIIPPNLPILLVEALIIWILIKALKPKNIYLPMFFYSIFGLFWEWFLGGLKFLGGLELIIVGAIVVISYIFVLIIPLTLIIPEKNA